MNRGWWRSQGSAGRRKGLALAGDPISAASRSAPGVRGPGRPRPTSRSPSWARPPVNRDRMPPTRKVPGVSAVQLDSEIEEVGRKRRRHGPGPPAAGSGPRRARIDRPATGLPTRRDRRLPSLRALHARPRGRRAQTTSRRGRDAELRRRAAPREDSRWARSRRRKPAQPGVTSVPSR